MLTLKYNSAVMHMRMVTNVIGPIKYFVLAIPMKLHILEQIDCSECTIIERNGVPTIAYPMRYLEQYDFQVTKSVYQGFIGFNDAPHGYRTGCNYSIDMQNQCVVLHTMR